MDTAKKYTGQKLTSLWRRLRPFMAQHRLFYLTTILFAIITLVSSAVFPQMIREVIDNGIQSDEKSQVSYWVAAMFILVVIQAFVTYLKAFMLERGALRVSIQIRSWILGRLLQNELAFFDEDEAELIPSRLIADTGQLNAVLGQLAPDTVEALLRCIIAGSLMFYTSPILAGGVCILGPLLWLGSSYLSKRIRKLSGPVQTSSSRLFAHASESINGILTVRTYHQESQTIDKHNLFGEEVLSVSRSSVKARAILEGYTNLFSEGAIVLAIWLGATLILNNQLTAGSLVTFILYAGLVTRGLTSLTRQGAALMQAQGATERLFEIAERETAMPYVHGKTPKTAQGKIEIDDLAFSYPTRKEFASLKGTSLQVSAGEEVAIVGASGCGKSTMAKLIARLYEPDEGQIRLDGHPLESLDTEWLRENITLVPPEPVMFSGTVSDNIRFGRPDATPEEVEAAARLAYADEFIQELPERYETAVGESGRLFSSGQRQRIALARAILRRPQVLILDESTAALDTQTESAVKESLRKLPNHPTLILISHRLSTIADAKRVIVLNDGKIVAEGTHNILLEDSEFYRELVKDQLLID